MISNLRRNDLKSFFVGSLLGDGGIAQYSKNTGKAYYIEGHSKKQEQYLKWKLAVISNSMNVTTVTNDVTMNVKGKTYQAVNGRSHASKYFGKLRKIFYAEERGGKKIIPIDFVRRHFNEMSLAILMLDDGHIAFGRDSKDHNPICAEVAICNFTRSEQEELIKIIEEKTGFKFKLRPLNKGKYQRLRLHGKNEIKRLIEIMRPYVTEDTKYKIDYSLRKAPKAREIADTHVV